MSDLFTSARPEYRRAQATNNARHGRPPITIAQRRNDGIIHAVVSGLAVVGFVALVIVGMALVTAGRL